MTGPFIRISVFGKWRHEDEDLRVTRDTAHWRPALLPESLSQSNRNNNNKKNQNLEATIPGSTGPAILVTWEAKAGRWQVQGFSGLRSKFKASLADLRCTGAASYV